MNAVKGCAAISAALLLASCFSWISGYDENTYKNLTYLKADTLVRLERCVERKGATIAELPGYESLHVRIAQAREYEIGKPRNSDTAAQFEILAAEIKQIADRLRDKQKLSEGYCGLKATVMRKAFDIAIATEGGKNRLP